MEYMDYTLDGYIAAHNSTLTIVQRKGIAQQILRAFDYLHSKGHLHRDISPKNILIKEYDDTLVVKLSDFGLVKIPDSTLVSIAKNYLMKEELEDLARIVNAFLNLAVGRAKRHIPMAMQDWGERISIFLLADDKDI